MISHGTFTKNVVVSIDEVIHVVLFQERAML